VEGGGVGRALARLELVVQESLVDLVADVDERVPVGVGEHPADPKVPRVVDGGLGSECTGLP